MNLVWFGFPWFDFVSFCRLSCEANPLLIRSFNSNLSFQNPISFSICENCGEVVENIEMHVEVCNGGSSNRDADPQGNSM